MDNFEYFLNLLVVKYPGIGIQEHEKVVVVDAFEHYRLLLLKYYILEHIVIFLVFHW